MNDRFLRWMMVWLLALATGWLVMRFVEQPYAAAPPVVETPRPVADREDLSAVEKRTIALFEAAAPSVVYIATEPNDRAGPSDRAGDAQSGAGSGFVWDANGRVVTNYHVVDGATRVRVRLDSGEAVTARVIGVDPDHDLAVVQLEETRQPPPPIPIGRSADLRVGQRVFAIGNPFGLSRTLSTGIVAALNRRLPTAGNREIAGVIQTDATINPGNSGGPLLDSSGRLIGITTAILSSTGAFAGVGFAVPVDIINRAIPSLIRSGRVPRPGIGILAAPEETAARLGVSGLVIAQVQPNSSAATAGLQGLERGSVGDIITQVNGKPVGTIAEFALELETVGIGKRAELTVVRAGRSRVVPVTVVDIAS